MEMIPPQMGIGTAALSVRLMGSEEMMTDMNTATVDLGLLGGDGTIIADGSGFLSRLAPPARTALVETARGCAGATAFEVIEQTPGAEMMVLAVASAQVARSWPLGGVDVAACADGAVMVCQLARDGIQRRLHDFAEAFGLSPAVARMVAALYETCDVRAAAAAAGLSFNTGREYLKLAREAIWAPNLPRLITWAGIGSLAADSSGESDHPAGALFSLSERQRQLAGLIADGASRADAARSVGISESLAKKELAAVYTATGVSNAIGLARLFAELRGLAIATGFATPHEPYPPPANRTLFVLGTDGRRIAVTDYGPTSGEPVLVLHNTMNCRGVDRSLVHALQNAGYRPLSPDRPGYGDTDPAPVDCHGPDYLRVCARDVAAICAHLKVDRIKLIAHGPVHVALAMLRHYPDLISRIVIDAPEPGSAYGAGSSGMIPSLKRMFTRRPWAVASAVRILTTLASHERIATLMRDWTADSPADRKVMEDPALFMDFYRKLIPFRRGRIDGFVREQVLQAKIGDPAPTPGTDRVTLVIGASDFMHDADESLRYWRATLPDAHIIMLSAAGRFISYSHPEQLVADLRRG